MTKDIIRFYETGKKKIVFYSVTEEQAKEWCNSPLTRKAGKYFDGFANAGAYGKERTAIYSNYFTPTEQYN